MTNSAVTDEVRPSKFCKTRYILNSQGPRALCHRAGAIQKAKTTIHLPKKYLCPIGIKI